MAVRRSSEPWVTLDIGASKPERGSLKVRVDPADGREPTVSEGVLSPNGFKTESDFVEAVAAAVHDAVASLPGRVAGVTLFVPGRVEGMHAPEGFQNLRLRGSDRPLGEIDFSPLETSLRASLAPGARFIPAHDMTGASLGTVSAIAAHPELGPLLENGRSFSFFYPGGGIGTEVFFRSPEDPTRIRIGRPITELHRELLRTRVPEVEQTTVPGLLGSFAAAYGLSAEKTRQLVDLGLAHVVTGQPIRTDDPDLIERLQASGLFKESRLGAEVEFRFAPDGKAEPARAASASRRAIEKFAEGMGIAAALRAREGVDTVLLIGRLVEALAEHVRRQPELFGGQSLVELVDAATARELGGDRPTSAHFSVRDDVVLRNNTSAGPLMAAISRRDDGSLDLPLSAVGLR